MTEAACINEAVLKHTKEIIILKKDSSGAGTPWGLCERVDKPSVRRRCTWVLHHQPALLCMLAGVRLQLV